jgi:hypothetical protein
MRRREARQHLARLGSEAVLLAGANLLDVELVDARVGASRSTARWSTRCPMPTPALDVPGLDAFAFPRSAAARRCRAQVEWHRREQEIGRL